jgi:hypothetical protein
MKKNKSGFNIIRNDSTTHGGYVTGTLSLSNLSSVLIDGDQAKIDLGLIHAKSAVERGIKWTTDLEQVPNGKKYWVIWVAVDRNEKGPYYAGVTACSMVIDREARIGWKILPEHVNRMDAALKRRIKLDGLSDVEKKALRDLLINNNEEMWNNSGDELKQALATTEN